MVAIIQKGCFVMARVGALGGGVKSDGTERKRQQRAWEEGVVINVIAKNEFEVQCILPRTGATLVKKLKSNQLRFVSAPPQSSAPPPAAINPTAGAASTAGGGVVTESGATAASNPTGSSTVLPTQPSDDVLEAIIDAAIDVASTTHLSGEAESNEPIVLEHHQDDAGIEDDDSSDDEEEMEEEDAHATKLRRSQDELRDLLIEGYNVKAGAITWLIAENSISPTVEEFEKVGVHSFDFREFQKLSKRLKQPHKKWGASEALKVAKRKLLIPPEDDNNYPYLNLFMLLWPGDWKSQLLQLNEAVALAQANASKNGKKARPMAEVTPDEWWTFVGIIIAASMCGFGGERLWDNDKSRAADGKRAFSTPPDFGKHMSKRRFDDIKSFFPQAFYDTSRSDLSANTYDPWWRVVGLFEAFNANRKATVLPSFTKTLDEIMSSYNPQSSKHGGLPNISFILRKPKPLGTEFKVTCCIVTGIMLHVEVQRGKTGMPKAHPDNAIHGATAACTLRQAEATVRNCNRAGDAPKKNLFYGDSWFASVKAAELIHQCGHSFVGPVKTNHKNFPKAAIEAKMAGWPGGTWLVLKGTTPSGVPLLAIGYKYNSRKVLSFVATTEAGSTLAGKPYRARYPDEFGNVVGRYVARPDILSKYFENSNAVDKHNQSRQFDLGLEMHWITQSCWFRIITTFIGITVIDAWKAFKHGVRDKSESNLSAVDFADKLVYELINRSFKDKATPLNLSPPTKIARTAPPAAVAHASITINTSPNEVSEITPASAFVHTMQWAAVDPKKGRAPRQRCQMCGQLTTLYCQECARTGKAYYCKDVSGGTKEKRCWSLHLEKSIEIDSD